VRLQEVVIHSKGDDEDEERERASLSIISASPGVDYRAELQQVPPWEVTVATPL
jgi:hypothetical protein